MTRIFAQFLLPAIVVGFTFIDMTFVVGDVNVNIPTFFWQTPMPQTYISP